MEQHTRLFKTSNRAVIGLYITLTEQYLYITLTEQYLNTLSRSIVEFDHT